MARLTDKTLAQSSAITPTTLIHIVYTGDPSQNVAGSSYKAQLQQLKSIFSGSTFSGGSGNCITDFYVTNIYGCSPVTIWDELHLKTIPTVATGNTLSITDDGHVVFASGETITKGPASFESPATFAAVADFQDNANFNQGLKSSFIRSFSPLLINDNNEGNVYFGSSSGVTIDVLNSRIGIGTLTPNTDLHVTGSTLIGGGLTANTISATTLTVNNKIISGDTFVTGLTFNTSNYNLTIGRNDGISFTDSLSILASDLTVTGGTYNPNTGNATFTNNTGGTFTVTGFLTGFTDTFISGGTYSNNTFTYTNTSGGTFSVSFNTVTGLTSSGNISSNSISANTITATTIGTASNLVNDVYVTNIHSSSELTINKNNEGNVYFGSSSGVTVDVSNSRIGVGTTTPTYQLELKNAGSTLYYDPTSASGMLRMSGTTGIPRYDVTIPGYLTRPTAGVVFGLRTWDDVTYTTYGKVGDAFLRAGNDTYGLNIINTPGTLTEDYIRFYAGSIATSTSDVHIQGTGTTRGYVGLNNENPTERLHVTGNAIISGNLTASTISASTIIVSGSTINPKQLIALFFGHDSLSPGDTQTYFIGNSINLTAPISGSDGRRVIMPKTGNIVRVGICQTVGGTLGSSEPSTFTVNNVTQATQSTITTGYTYDASSANISYVLASPLAVTEGDKIELRWTTPTWVTNPTTVRHQMNVYLEY